MNIPQWEQWIHERHVHWHGVMNDYFGHRAYRVWTPPNLSDVKIVNRAPKKAGCYNSREHLCTYYLPYAIVAGEHEYDKTIAHEVCHSWQWTIRPGISAHGEFFLYLLNEVCGFTKADRWHTYSTSKAKKVQALIRAHYSMKGKHNGNGKVLS